MRYYPRLRVLWDWAFSKRGKGGQGVIADSFLMHLFLDYTNIAGECAGQIPSRPLAWSRRGKGENTGEIEDI